MNKYAETDEFELDFSSLLDLPPAAAAAVADTTVASLAERKAKPAAAEGEKYVVFQLDDKLYAVHSRQVSEVIGSLAVAPLPPLIADRAEWLAGIANLRGNIIGVIDLRKLWKKQTAAPRRAKLLVLRSEKDAAAAAVAENHRGGGAPPRRAAASAPDASAAAAEAAFVVDRFSEMITLTPQEIKFSAEDFASSFPTFFGRVARGSQTIFLLDAENLFSSLAVPAS